MLTEEERRFFEVEQAHHETMYLAGTNPRAQSGFRRDQVDWERFRRVVTAPIDKDGTFLDVGCASGLLMESVVEWAAQDGFRIEPYGLDISPKLAALARQRLPRWQDRIFIGNALSWVPPFPFDFVRTEMAYVPPTLRRRYVEHLLDAVVAPAGCLIACSYGSSRPTGARAEPLVDEFAAWGMPVAGVHDRTSAEHGFVVTRAINIRKRPGVRHG